MLKLAIVQLDRKPKKEDNLAGILSLVRSLRADVILLPENWLGTELLMFEEYLSYVEKVAAVLSGDVLLAAGAQYISAGNEILSRGAFVRNGSGKLVCYEKIFPSQAVGERQVLQPGKGTPVVEHAGWKIAAVVCVDLFYPEIARHLALAGCQVILNPVSIPHDRLSLWQALGLVRASENTVFLASANNAGGVYPDGREITGGSFVALPDGRLGPVAGSGEKVLVFDLDQDLIAQTRKRWPYLEDVQKNYQSGGIFLDRARKCI